MPTTKNNRRGYEEKNRKGRLAEKASSFHGRIPEAMVVGNFHRPRTVPDLLSGRNVAGLSTAEIKPKLTKLLLNVTIQRSLGPVMVIISPESTVGDLIAAALREYSKEGRRPILGAPDSSGFDLHYSQFSLESLDRKFVPQTIPLANGRISDHVVDASSTRTGSVLGLGSTLPYTHSTVYGYNGPSLGPTIPFSSAMYGLGGHIPYMMDSRGSPVVPQILGSASSALPPAFSQPPFIMSMTGAPSGSNGFVPLRHNFDLNSGMMMDGGNRDAGGLRQLFNSGQGRSIDEHMRANSQPTSSFGVGGKRKETDGGWEHYPFNYKHHQPPRK